MKDIEEESDKLDMTSMKVTSTPSKNVKNIMQDSYTFTQDSATLKMKQDSIWASPKNSKSVLKSASDKMGNLVKKKVLFDLEKQTSPLRNVNASRSIGDFVAEMKGETNEDGDEDGQENPTSPKFV